ncbi:MAG: VanZ family protein [Bacteroidales bacterium]|nr:VanZ family protein [Bacteroidales bacterium]
MQFIKKYKFSFFWTIIVFILCLLPGSNLPKTGFHIPHFDKIVHFGMFFIFSILFNYEKKAERNSNSLVIILILSLLIALSTEISQLLFTTTRQFDLLDLSADLLGSIVGYFSYFILKQKLN